MAYLSRSVIARRKREFVVREIWFEPIQEPEACVFVLGAPRDETEGVSVPLSFPFHIVRVQDATDGKPTLTIYYETVTGAQMDAFSSGSYQREEMVQAMFRLPPGMKMLTPKGAD